MDSVYQLYAKLVVLEGGTPLPGDSLRGLVRKLADALGAQTDSFDSKNALLRKYSSAVGEIPKPGDSDQVILQRLAAMPTGSSEWDCLRALVPSTDVALIPEPLETPEPPGPVTGGDDSGFLPGGDESSSGFGEASHAPDPPLV